jgi:hypothetical protein
MANVGVALLVYARDEGVGRRIRDVSTSWTGCGIGGYMGNKGAVGVRFRVVPEFDESHEPGEIFTYVGTVCRPLYTRTDSRERIGL